MDESILTGESDGVRRGEGDRLLSGAFCIAGSGYYELDAVRDQSHAAKVAGEARAFRHPLSPLQVEVNSVLRATTILMIPLAVLLLLALAIRSVPIDQAAQTATAGLVTLIPEGLVLLMSVTLAVAAVRLARMNTLVQQMAATEALAAVDTVCVDKTGTLTDGTLSLVSVEVADETQPKVAHDALARFAHSAGERNRTLETIAERYPGKPERVLAEVPFSSVWKWSGLTLDGRGARASYVLGAPDVLASAGALQLSPSLQRTLEQHTAAGRRVVAFAEARGPLPSDPGSQPPPPLEPRALIVLEEQLRSDAAETIEFLRQQNVDLKLISGDARQTVTAVAHAVGVPRDAGVIEGPELPADNEGLAAAAESNTIFCRITPDQKKALVGALAERGRFTGMIGDGVNDVPALKQARLAVAMGSGSQVTKGIADIVLLKDQFSMLPRAVGEGRRIARNIHRLGRLYADQDDLRRDPDPDHRDLRVHVPLPAPPAHGRGPADHRHPLLRACTRAERGPPVPGPPPPGPRGLRRARRRRDSPGLTALLLPRPRRRGTLDEGRTAATTTLIVLGLCFILLLERGPGREHITIQSYMLAMVAGLGALYALILAAAPVRSFFDLQLLSAGQWFLCLLCTAAGLVVAALAWRLPYIQMLEAPVPAEPEVET